MLNSLKAVTLHEWLEAAFDAAFYIGTFALGIVGSVFVVALIGMMFR